MADDLVEPQLRRARISARAPGNRGPQILRVRWSADHEADCCGAKLLWPRSICMAKTA